MLSLVVFLIGLLLGVFTAFTGGFISIIAYIGIGIGLFKRQEWARVLLLWMCYTSIVMNGIQGYAVLWLTIPVIVFEIITLLLAHHRSVRSITQKHSIATTYTYTEANP